MQGLDDRQQKIKFKATDLFCGGGGLTVGLKNAGFSVRSAIEINGVAAETYAANHPEVNLITKDIKEVRSDELQVAGEEIDLVAGCPPCQGFTSLTSKYRREDKRNALIEEMGRLVRELRPKAVMMENVPGLAHKGKNLLDSFIKDLTEAGYDVAWDVLQVADYGTPQFRRRLVLLAGLGFYIPLPKPSHSKSGLNGLPRWRRAEDVFKGFSPPSVFTKAALPMTGGTVEEWHMVRRISPSNVERLRWAIPGGSWKDIPAEHRVPCHQGDYGGFSNVYGRIAWDATPPTITAGCTTPSKGRFGHPDELRTISVREAALIQEFPDKYMIATPYMEQACGIIGNALPCGFATIMAKQVNLALCNSKTTDTSIPSR